MGRIIHIRANAAQEEWPAYSPPTYEVCKEAVRSGTQDVLIEIVYCLYEGEPTQMIVHESGLLHRLPLNEKATAIYRASIKSEAEIQEEFAAAREANFTVIDLRPPGLPEIVGDVLLLVGKDVWLD